LFQNGQLATLIEARYISSFTLCFYSIICSKIKRRFYFLHILLLRKELRLPDSSVDLGGEGRLTDDGNPQGLRHSFSLNTTKKNFIKIFMICPYRYGADTGSEQHAMD
jgi:hypothetical protein